MHNTYIIIYYKIEYYNKINLNLETFCIAACQLEMILAVRKPS